MPDDDVRSRILIEAVRLFADQGYGSTSVREVVEAARVTKPTLYYHFGSKEALFLEAVRSRTDALRSLVEDSVAHGPDTAERLRAFITAYLAFAAENGAGMRLLMTVHYRPDEGQPEVDLLSVHRRNGELLAAVLAEGVRTGRLRADLDVQETVMALVGMVHLRCGAAARGVPLRAGAADRLFDLFFHGVAR